MNLGKTWEQILELWLVSWFHLDQIWVKYGLIISEPIILWWFQCGNLIDSLSSPPWCSKKISSSWTPSPNSNGVSNYEDVCPGPFILTRAQIDPSFCCVKLEWTTWYWSQIILTIAGYILTPHWNSVKSFILATSKHQLGSHLLRAKLPIVLDPAIIHRFIIMSNLW